MAPDLPDDFPVLERHAVRVVVLDTDDRVLLFRDPVHPRLGEVVVTVRLAGPGPERFYPGRLPELLPALLAGEQVDEPFELWS